MYNTIPQIIYQNIKNSQQSQNQIFQKNQKKKKITIANSLSREFGVRYGTQEPEAANSGNDGSSGGASDGGGGFGIYGNLGDFGPKKILSKYEKARWGGIFSEEERKMEDFQ